MRYNTLVCNVLEVQQQLNGDYLLKGVVTSAVGEDYRPTQSVAIGIQAAKADYLNGVKPGTYLLERVDPESNYCLHPSIIQEGKIAIPAMVGPLQISWTDNGKNFHAVTLNKEGLQGDALQQAAEVIKRFPGNMRVYRDLVELDPAGDPMGAMKTATAGWEKQVANLIEDFPSMTSVIVRDGKQASIARLAWNKETETRELSPLRKRDGTPFLFKGDEVELIPVHQVNYLSNRMNPKKSTAVTVVNRETQKSDRQLAYESKLYPEWGYFASGIAVLRQLPSGGRTLESVAASFPSVSYKSVPGALVIADIPKDSVNVVETTRTLLKSLGIPEEKIREVLEIAKNKPGPTHGAELQDATDAGPGIPRTGYVESTQTAAREAQRGMRQEKAPAEENQARPVAPSAPATPSAGEGAPPAPAYPRTPKIQFGRKR